MIHSSVDDNAITTYVAWSADSAPCEPTIMTYLGAFTADAAATLP
jgi:hypothetical protein